ncbi:uncharacterized protein LOC120335003 isoform X2 [Styela clava]
MTQLPPAAIRTCNVTVMQNEADSHPSLEVIIFPIHFENITLNCASWTIQGQRSIEEARPFASFQDRKDSCTDTISKYCRSKAILDTDRCTLYLTNGPNPGGKLENSVNFTCTPLITTNTHFTATTPTENTTQKVPVNTDKDMAGDNFPVWVIILIASVIMVIILMIVAYRIVKRRKAARKESITAKGDGNVPQDGANNPVFESDYTLAVDPNNSRGNDASSASTSQPTPQAVVNNYEEAKPLGHVTDNENNGPSTSNLYHVINDAPGNETTREGLYHVIKDLAPKSESRDGNESEREMVDNVLYNM